MRIYKRKIYRSGRALVLMAMTAGVPLAGQADLLTLVSSSGLYAIDAYVHEGEPDTAHSYDGVDTDQGTDAVLQIDKEMDGRREQTHGLLSFNTLFGNGSNQIPLGSTIHSATLSLWYVNHNRNKKIAMYTLTEDWDDGVTWNSLGGGIVAGSNATKQRTINWGQLVPSTVTVDVLDDIIAWSAGTNNYGWGFVDSHKNGLQIAATENTTGTPGWHTPTLEVDYTPVAVPEPAVIGLIVFAGMGMLVGRRLLTYSTCI